MSFPNTVYLSYEQALTESSTKGGIPLGTRGITPDGRVFRWTKNGATALKVGMGVTPAALGEYACINTSAGLTSIPAGTTAKTGAFKMEIGGSMYGSAVSANTYADGYLLIGSTQYYTATMLRIKSHGGTGDTTSGTMVDSPTTWFLKDPLPFDVNTSLGFGLVLNPYDGVLVMATNSHQTLPIIGITQIAVTASYYFWLQTAGLGIAKMSEACTSATVLGRGLKPGVTASTTGFEVICSSANSATEGAWNAFATLQTGCTAGGYAVVNIACSP